MRERRGVTLRGAKKEVNQVESESLNAEDAEKPRTRREIRVESQLRVFRLEFAGIIVLKSVLSVGRVSAGNGGHEKLIGDSPGVDEIEGVRAK